MLLEIVFVWFSLGQCFCRHDPVVYCFMGYQSDIGIILFAPPLQGLCRSFGGPGLLTAVRRSRRWPLPGKIGGGLMGLGALKNLTYEVTAVCIAFAPLMLELWWGVADGSPKN